MTFYDKKRNGGYVLIELLTALTLFSFAGTSLYNGFIEGTRCYRRIEESSQVFSGPKVFFIQIESDLRNMAVIREENFEGKNNSIRFPAVLPFTDSGGKMSFRLVRIHYYLQGKKLIREEEEISSKLKNTYRKKKIVLKDIKSFKFSFPYREPNGVPGFTDFWVQSSDSSLPRAVRIDLNSSGLRLEKTVSIPQGHFGQFLGGDLPLWN